MKRTWASLRPQELSKDLCANRKERTSKNQGLKAYVVTLKFGAMERKISQRGLGGGAEGEEAVQAGGCWEPKEGHVSKRSY